MDESLGWVLVIEDFVERVCSRMSLFSFFKRSQLQSQMRQESRVHPVLLDSNMEGTPLTNMSLKPLFDHWICYSCIRFDNFEKSFRHLVVHECSIVKRLLKYGGQTLVKLSLVSSIHNQEMFLIPLLLPAKLFKEKTKLVRDRVDGV
ncbi:unnamed protein product [Musa acuminata subsp. burmannicoides]